MRIGIKCQRITPMLGRCESIKEERKRRFSLEMTPEKKNSVDPKNGIPWIWYVAFVWGITMLAFEGMAHHQLSLSQFASYVMDSPAVKSLFPTRAPRHLLEGLSLGLRSTWVGMGLALASGLALPVAGFLRRPKEEDSVQEAPNPWIGGLVGGIYGILYGLTFLLVGFLNAVYQTMRGLLQTPQAVLAARQGMVWDVEKETWKFYSLQEEFDEIISSSRPNVFKERPIQDMTYYNLLHVPATASVSEIKQAYRRAARAVHPDKNPGNETAAELFHQLHRAFVTLSDDEQRRAYDTWGAPKNGSDAQGIPPFDPQVFFSILFHVQPVEHYVGNCTLSLATSHMMYFLQSGGVDSAEDLWKFFGRRTVDAGVSLSQRKRELNMALFLKDRVTPFANGAVNRSEFREQCQQEAWSIAQGLFGRDYLYAIGTAFINEANQALKFRGSILAPWNRMVVWFRNKRYIMKSIFSMLGALLDTMQKIKLREGAPSDAELMELLAPLTIDVAWVYNSLDFQNALSGACHRLFADSQVNSRYTRLERAEAIRILGEEFLLVAQQESERFETDKHAPEDLLLLLELAGRVANMKVRS